MVRRFGFFGFIVACLVPSIASAAISVSTVTIPPTSRSVAAASTGAAGDGDSTPAGGVYTHGASSVGSSPAGFVSSTATQSSVIPDLVGPSMTGVGSSSVLVDATGFTGFSVFADSFFDVFFSVTVDQTYRLDADVNWGGDFPPFGGYARVQLMDVTNMLVPFDVQRDSMLPGTASLDLLIPLYIGNLYRLRAESHIAGGFATAGVYDATAGWNFTFTVPEPTSATLVFIAMLATTGITARRRRTT